MNSVSVVIPATSYDDRLESCLLSLREQKNIRIETWVVFNPSMPDIGKEKWPENFHFIQTEKGVNRARNAGLLKSNFDLVLFLDSDCELNDPFHIEKLSKQLAEDSSIAGVGGGYEIPSDSNLPTKAYHFLQMEWLRQQYIDEKFHSKALIGGHMLLRKSMLPELKFDERIIFGGSEKEFFVRAHALGRIFYLDLSLSVLHNSQITRQQLLDKAKAQGTGEKYIHTRHGKSSQSEIEYVFKSEVDPQCLGLIDEYRRTFSKYSGLATTSINPAKKFIYSMIEHLSTSQSSKD
jgi:glycosyltransferase involved in cell wall biosynthesis